MFQFYLILIFLSSLFFLIYNFTINPKTQRFNLPPGPRGFPVIGHLFSIEPLVYRYYHRISLKYGPIFSLRFGLRRVVVISSYSLFKECFTGENDIVLANRPTFFTNKYIAYNNGTVGTSPYGDHWRNLRRICSLEILSSHRLATFLDIRRDEIRRMLTRLSRDNYTKNLESKNLDSKNLESKNLESKNLDSKNLDSFKEVELEPLLSDLTFNNIVRMVTGKRYYGEDVKNKEEADIFKKIIKDISESSSSNQSSNYLPFLKFFGNKFEMKVKEIGVSVDTFLQRLLDECRKNKDGKTMVNHLVSLQDQEPEYYNNVTIKGLMMGLIIPGTDSSSITMGWAMANLLNHPEVMKKAREEIDEKVGQERLMDEEDLPNLPYLQNVISETFRLFPAAPLLVAREASKDIKIGGYDIPRGTMLLVNAWVIHRDPDLWDDPEKFNPDRFKEYAVITEESFDSVQRLMPFGHGRRSCPASGLARRIITWAVGSLIQCFDWKSIDGGKVDMEESPGLLMRKQENLRVMCRPRPVMSKFLAQANS